MLLREWMEGFNRLLWFLLFGSLLNKVQPACPHVVPAARLLPPPPSVILPPWGGREVTSSPRPPALNIQMTPESALMKHQTDAFINRLPSQRSTVGFTRKDGGDFEP